MHSDMCTQQILKSACVSAQYDQSFRCPHEETLHHLAVQNAPKDDSDQFMYDSDLWYTVEFIHEHPSPQPGCAVVHVKVCGPSVVEYYLTESLLFGLKYISTSTLSSYWNSTFNCKKNCHAAHKITYNFTFKR